jgi:hypothetical protein
MYNRIRQASAFLIMMAALTASISLSYTYAWAADSDDPTEEMRIAAALSRGPSGPQGPPWIPGPWIYLTFESCSGTNGNHDVTCNVHDETGITHLTCTVANPAISGGDNVGNCITNNSKHLLCTIPPQPGVFGCNLQS